MLYVALTRARRGLYVLLEPPGKTNEPDRPSLGNWIARCVDSAGGPGVVWQSGSPAWTASVPAMAPAPAAAETSSPGPAVTRRPRVTPSGLKKSAALPIPRSAAGMRFGSEVHAAFEAVGWLDESSPTLPRTEAGKLVSELLELPELRKIFTRGGRAAELFREQPIDAIMGGNWLSGVIDRLHLERDAAGAVTRVEVIDFKTDRVDTMAALAGRYTSQMAAYREAMALAYPAAKVDCVLVSTRWKAAVAV
jgi:ATP-dependent exoDNAse (exonuclease V) beta subunit